MNLKKVLIGFLIGILLFCVCNKIFLVEGVETDPVNSCRDRDGITNPDTCNAVNRCYDSDNGVCNAVVNDLLPNEEAAKNKCISAYCKEDKDCWCELNDRVETCDTALLKDLCLTNKTYNECMRCAGTHQFDLQKHCTESDLEKICNEAEDSPPSPPPNPSKSDIERECKKIKCPFKDEEGKLHACLTNIMENGEFVYECADVDEQKCVSAPGVQRNMCTNELFSREIPQKDNFKEREISLKNQCKRPIQIVSSIPGGIARCGDDNTSQPTVIPPTGPKTCSAIFDDNRINKGKFGREACPEGCTYNDNFPAETGNWLADNKDPACSPDGYGFGALKSDGQACKNTFVYRTDVIPANSSDSWTEKLYETSGNLKGCSKDKFCRPGTNYTAIWADTDMPDDKRIEYMNMQGKSEFTFGADYNKDDNYDASAMLIGGCGAHTNPWNNDLGFTDLSTPDQPCGDGFNINKTNQTMHNKSDLATIMSGGELTDENKMKRYQSYGKILDKLKNKEEWINSQKKGCFIDGKDNMGGGCVIIDNNNNKPDSAEHYACGFPLYYNYGDKTYLFVDDDGDRGFYDITGKTETDILNMVDSIISDEEFRNNNIIKNNSLFNELSTAMRNELYECTSSQSKAHVDQLNKTPGPDKPYLFPNNPDDQQTDFIPFQINVTSDTQCNEGSVIRNNETCSIVGYPKSLGGKGVNQPAVTCASGYMFNFDDMNSGQQCNMEDSQLTDKPKYEIVYCPENN